MKFIDLFAGLGGFHVGLKALEHECVYSCEKDKKLAKLYKSNFGIDVDGDIRKIDLNEIPKHDILCAGFPCQPFSKAGFQNGFEDKDQGTLFNEIFKILISHKPKYFILENVANIISHNDGKTWNHLIDLLQNELGYNIAHKRLSPHLYGIPQIRDRVFIVGSKENIDYFNWPKESKKQTSITSILESDNKNRVMLPSRELKCLNMWQEFIKAIPQNTKLPSFPIWAMEFGATYPYIDSTPYHTSKNKLSNYKGMFGEQLNNMSHKEQLLRIPNYARHEIHQFPKWKQNFIYQNREFYLENKEFIDPFIPTIIKLPPSWQKLEWNCQGEPRDLFKYIIQFRASGIRIKRTNYSPSLIASTTTQIPIIGWEKRYMTKLEAAKLQSLESIALPESDSEAFKALGNAVNASIVKRIAEKLII